VGNDSLVIALLVQVKPDMCNITVAIIFLLSCRMWYINSFNDLETTLLSLQIDKKNLAMLIFFFTILFYFNITFIAVSTQHLTTLKETLPSYNK